ncbi:hypothetical protein GF360_02115 [candidate division WWE3 bacterium]|nr:hypothetical protein [candidate division WWE3 bacterium]
MEISVKERRMAIKGFKTDKQTVLIQGNEGFVRWERLPGRLPEEDGNFGFYDHGFLEAESLEEALRKGRIKKADVKVL